MMVNGYLDPDEDTPLVSFCPSVTRRSIRGFHKQRVAIVLGNGPSLKLLDFDELKSRYIASVGMNAAYRYWKKIDFRPTYYICMDTVVIMSHAENIVSLIEEGRIRKFFLRDELKEKFPELADHERIFWFSDAVQDENPIFKSNFITTGSWAIRWMLHEGMHIVGTLGIDANYMEFLDESNRVGKGDDLTLKITEKPKFNPNYFFDEYQIKGDKYNIPNSPSYKEKTGRLVHIDALKKVQEDSKELGFSSQIIDFSPISNHRIFPKENLDAFLWKFCMSVITSFHENSINDTLEGNVQMAILNSENPFIDVVHVLYEGSVDQLERKLPKVTAGRLKTCINNNTIKMIECDTRPSYRKLFEYANSFIGKPVAVTNSDLLFDCHTVESILVDRFNGNKSFIALTRWNCTKNGIYIQGVSATPPWQEVHLDDIEYKNRNYSSFDTYIFDSPIPTFDHLSQIHIGSLGCDTALIALLRVYGISVSNPCLKYKILHIDDKPRKHGDSPSARARNVLLNANSVKELVIHRYAKLKPIFDKLIALSEIRQTIFSIGEPQLSSLDVWRMLVRVLGESPWIDEVLIHAINFVRIDITVDDLPSDSGRIIKTARTAMAENAYIEWVIHGNDTELNISENFSVTAELRQLYDQLQHYKRQSAILWGAATDAEKDIYLTLMFVLQDIFGGTAQQEKGIYPMRSLSRIEIRNSQPLIGPLERKSHAHLDETSCIAELFARLLQGSVMIDVGAHHGSALFPFLDRGWGIFAFEPDEKNRSQLMKRLRDHKYKNKIKVDSHAVSDQNKSEMPFYQSDISTGISGLSSFHDTHRLVQRVEITTLREVFENESVRNIDFLKIDTEGYDLFVLRGFPWEKYKPAVIKCKFEDLKTIPLGYNFHDISTYLTNRGYSVYVSEWHPIIRYGIRHEWKRLVRYPCELSDKKAWGNLLAFRDPIGEKDLMATVGKMLKIGAGDTTKPAA